MKIAAAPLLLAAALIAVSLPAQGQSSFGGGSTFGGGAARGGSFGGGAPFANGSMQMYNPAVMNNPALNPYGYGYGSGYSPYGGSYGLGYPGYAPMYQAPIGVPGVPSYFRIGPLNAQYWRSPSGYYYPWGVSAGGIGVPPQIYYVNQGQTQVQNPPVYAMLTDMRKFLDDMRRNGRLNEADYLHLFHRVQDLQGKYDHLMAMSGTLDASDEDSIRRDAGILGSEISQRVKPLAQAAGDPVGGPGQAGQPAASKSGWVEER